MTSTISSGCNVSDIDDSYFKKHSDEICVTWFPHNECSYVIDAYDQTHVNSRMKLDKDAQFVLTNGLFTCEIIATGYLRQNLINPKDINTIISKYLCQTKIQISAENKDQKCLVLFPSMKRVCINLSHVFEANHSSRIDARFGIIGIPQNDEHINIKTFYKLLHKYDSKLRSSYWSVNLAGIRRLVGYIFNKFEKDDRKINNNNNKQHSFDMEVVEYSVCRTRAANCISFSIEYCGKLTRNHWGVVVDKSQNMRKISNQRLSDKFRFNKGDNIVLEYDKNENTLSIALYGNKPNSKPEFVTMENKIYHTSPIKAKKEKLILEKGYDYVLACCINGRNQIPPKNNILTFSSKLDNLSTF